jgi:hypothetical protein
LDEKTQRAKEIIQPISGVRQRNPSPVLDCGDKRPNPDIIEFVPEAILGLPLIEGGREQTWHLSCIRKEGLPNLAA